MVGKVDLASRQCWQYNGNILVIYRQYTGNIREKADDEMEKGEGLVARSGLGNISRAATSILGCIH